MNLNFLRTFVTVVEEGNYSRAANRLHLSQPAVSMQMQSLARELGVELFHRRGHRVCPTEAGDILYQQARVLLQEWQGTVQKLDGLSQRLRGRLELGASTVPGDFLLPPELCDFYCLHPELDLCLKVAPSQVIVEDLMQGNVELAVVGYKPEAEGLKSNVLFTDQLGLVCSPGHVLARRSVSVQDILAQPMLMRTHGSATRSVLEGALERLGCGKKMQVAMELGSSRALLEAAARNIGVAVVSKVAAADYIHQGRLVWKDIPGLDLQRSFWLVQSRGSKSAVAQAFIQYLQRSDHRG